jgi:hypothetical protein
VWRSGPAISACDRSAGRELDDLGERYDVDDGGPDADVLAARSQTVEVGHLEPGGVGLLDPGGPITRAARREQTGQ